MKKYTGILLILSVLTISVAAESIFSASEQYHKPKIRVGTISGYALNWAGYAVNSTNGSVTDVKGSWTVPEVTCKGSKYSSFWVGIDGDNSDTVEQIGTDSDCIGNKPVYYAWYEFYPNPMHIISSITVSPGDNISAEVNYNATTNNFTVSLNNTNTHENFSISFSNESLNAARSSAEWIAEAPSIGNKILQLANFGTAYFGFDYTGVSGTSYATVNGTTGNISYFNSTGTIDNITMVNKFGMPKAVPSAVTSEGTSFSVKWYHS